MCPCSPLISLGRSSLLCTVFLSLLSLHAQVNLSNFDIVMESDMGTFTPVGLQFAGSEEARKVRGMKPKVSSIVSNHSGFHSNFSCLFPYFPPYFAQSLSLDIPPYDRYI